MTKILVDKSVIEQALEAFEIHARQYPHMVKGYTLDAEEALRAALEQPQPKREPIPNVMMDLGWELHGSNDPYQSWCMAVEWTERAHGIGE